MTSEPLECRALLSASPVAVAADASADVTPMALAVQADGKLVAVGTTNVNGTNDFVVARYNADGTIDTTFGTSGRVITDFDGGDDLARGVAIQTDGRIVVAGQGSWQAGPGYTYAVARYNADGSLDSTFDGDGKARRPGLATNAMALAPDGKIVLAGSNASGLDFSNQIVVVRLNADGSTDATFGSEGRAVVMMGTWGATAYDVDVQDDGQVIFGGRGIIPPPPFGHGLPPVWIGLVGRLHADGSADTTRVVSELPSIRQVLAAPDGQVLYTGLNSYDDVVVRRVGTDLSTAGSSFGTLGGYTFSMAGTGLPRALELQPDGKVVVAMIDADGANTRDLVGRITPAGVPDFAFGSAGGVANLPTGDSFRDLADAVVQPSGRIVALGTRTVDGHKDFSLAALTAAGAPDATFRFAQPAPPQVTQVWVGSSDWTTAFRQFLASSEPRADASYGHALLGGGTGPSLPLPWVNLNQIALRFDRPATVGLHDLHVRGVNVPEYALTDFRYDADTNTSVWTLERPIGADRVTLELDPGTFSGAQPLRLDVLPGDVDGNGAVVAADASAVKRSFFRSTTNPGTGDDAYSARRDVDGSGAILASDFSQVKQRFFTRLPDDNGAATAPPATGILRET